MSVRSEDWSPDPMPTSGAPRPGAPEVAGSGLVAAGTDVRSPTARKPHAPGLPRLVSARRGGVVVAGLLAAVGAFFVWQSSQLDLGNVDLPGPGFFPLVLGAVLLIFSAVIGIGDWRASKNDAIKNDAIRSDANKSEAVELGHRDVAIAIAALLAVPLVFEPLGAYITLGLFGTVLLVLLGRVPPLLAIGAACLAMAGCWYFFQVLLGLQLPTGLF
jgi:putative tricarboxylic transport membrane protein